MRDTTLTDQQRFEMICVAKRKAGVPMHLGWSFFLLFAGFIGVLALLGTIFWMWMIVDCALNEPPDGNTKALWLVIIVLLSLIGAAMYYFVRRPERMHIVGR